MLAQTITYALDGIKSRPVDLTTEITAGLPAFAVTGIRDTAVRETRERVRAAILNEGFEFPARRISVTLAPPTNQGPYSFDLAIAYTILAASGQLDPEPFGLAAFLGELSLDGAVQPIRGILAAATSAKTDPINKLFVPRANAQEAMLAVPSAAIGIRRLGDLRDFANGKREQIEVHEPAEPSASGPDLCDLRGHAAGTRAIEIAAAGGHNLLLRGPQGCGRTMLSRRIPSILPPMTQDEALAVTNIQSIAGSLRVDGLAQHRPFRAPHHTISASGLVGGKTSPLPGEATLASGGLLFLDLLPDFSTKVTESLLEALNTGKVTIERNTRIYEYPANFLLVAASDPCPCGAAPDHCECTEAERETYERQFAGPLADYFDISCAITRPTQEEVCDGPITNSATVRRNVIAARAMQIERFGHGAISCNGQLDGSQTRRLLRPSDSVRELLNTKYVDQELTLRGYDRSLRVARTIADLASSPTVELDHATEALSLISPAFTARVPA